MKTLLTLEMVTLVNGLAIQHSSEWEDYLEMNAQINGMTKEEYTAHYLGTQWQMQCMESLQMLAEKKVTRKQLDKAINDVAKITNELKKVVKEWAAARDAGNSEKQEEKLQELKKLNDEKSAAQDVVDDHIQQLDKNATLQTTESMNEKKSEFKEGDKVKLTLKGLQQMNRGRTPGISNNYSRSLGKIRDKDISGTVEKVFPSGSMNVDFDGVLYDIKDYMVVKESVNEAVSRSTKIYCVATPAPRKMLVQELEDIFGDDYRHIVTEFTDDEGYESVLLFNLTKNDIASIQKKVQDVLIWEYSIKKGKEIMESIDEKYRETRHQSTDFSKPGNDGDIYFSKREGDAVGIKRGDKLQMIYVFQKEPKFGKIQKSDKRWENMGPASEELLIKLRGRADGKILFDFVSNLEESMNEKIQVASLEDAIDAEQGGDLNKRHLDKILKLKAAKRMHTMSRSEEKTYQAILRKYKIATDNAHVEDMMEAIDIDMVNTAYGFWGTMSASHDEEQIETAIEDAITILTSRFKFTEEGAYNFLNSKWGRKLADEYLDGQHYNMVDAIEAFTSPSTYKKYAKQFNEAEVNTMKNLQTLESFINEAAPKLKTSKEEAGLLKLRDEIRRARKGGSASNYSKEFDAAKKKALKAVEDMITYAKIGV